MINNNKTKLLIEIAIDMSSNAIVGWKVNQSENAITVLNVINQVAKANRKKHKIFATFIQSDLGSGNTSKIVTNSFKRRNWNKCINKKIIEWSSKTEQEINCEIKEAEYKLDCEKKHIEYHPIQHV